MGLTQKGKDAKSIESVFNISELVPKAAVESAALEFCDRLFRFGPQLVRECHDAKNPIVSPDQHSGLPGGFAGGFAEELAG